MFKKTNFDKTQKMKITLLFVFILAIVFSPYTIVKLTSYGEELFSDDPSYQALEDQLLQSQAQEQAVLAELEKINTAPQIAPIDITETALTEEVITPQTAEVAGTENASPESILTGIMPPQTEEAQPIENSETPKQSAPLPAFDPAIAPGTVKAKLLLSTTKKAPDFSVQIKFIAVGDENFEVNTDKNGKLEISLISGRYYAEIIPADDSYRLEGNAPAFFLNANSKKDLGTLYLVKK